MPGIPSLFGSATALVSCPVMSVMACWPRWFGAWHSIAKELGMADGFVFGLAVGWAEALVVVAAFWAASVWRAR